MKRAAAVIILAALAWPAVAEKKPLPAAGPSETIQQVGCIEYWLATAEVMERLGFRMLGHDTGDWSGAVDFEWVGGELLDSTGKLTTAKLGWLTGVYDFHPTSARLQWQTLRKTADLPERCAAKLEISYVALVAGYFTEGYRRLMSNGAWEQSIYKLVVEELKKPIYQK